MGTNTLIDKSDPHNIVADDWNDIHTAIAGDFVGRQKSGSSSAATSGQNLGTPAVPWGAVYTNGLYVSGTLIDFNNLTGDSNGIISGAVRSTSNQPDFLRASGSTAELDVLGATTNLIYNVGGTGTTISTDITVSSLTVAPSSNNTCLVNDTSLADQDFTKYQGEFGTEITVDSMGSEISGRVGQYVALKHGTSEIMLAYVESSTKLTNVKRGYFFNSSGTPIERETMANNDTLTLYELAWVFAEDNGTTIDVTYTTPVYSYTSPTSPATDDYWFDITNSVWKRYDGSLWQTINRLLIGMGVVDTSNCVATRSLDFSASFLNYIDFNIEYVSSTVLKTSKRFAHLSVYGNDVIFDQTGLQWDITADIESGQSESSSTVFYVYVTQDGQPILSKTMPYDRRSDLKGFYHPYNTWRCVGSFYNNGSSNIEVVENTVENKTYNFINFTTTGTSTFLTPVGVKECSVELCGGGGAGYGITSVNRAGGGAGGYGRGTFALYSSEIVTVTVGAGGSSNGSNGSSSSFGSKISCTGGSGGASSGTGGAGGQPSGAFFGGVGASGANGTNSGGTSGGGNSIGSGTTTGSTTNYGQGGSGTLPTAFVAGHQGIVSVWF